MFLQATDGARIGNFNYENETRPKILLHTEKVELLSRQLLVSQVKGNKADEHRLLSCASAYE